MYINGTQLPLCAVLRLRALCVADVSCMYTGCSVKCWPALDCLFVDVFVHVPMYVISTAICQSVVCVIISVLFYMLQEVAFCSPIHWYLCCIDSGRKSSFIHWVLWLPFDFLSLARMTGRTFQEPIERPADIYTSLASMPPSWYTKEKSSHGSLQRNTVRVCFSVFHLLPSGFQSGITWHLCHLCPLPEKKSYESLELSPRAWLTLLQCHKVSLRPSLAQLQVQPIA